MMIVNKNVKRKALKVLNDFRSGGEESCSGSSGEGHSEKITRVTVT
jgi:hypothetical protein